MSTYSFKTSKWSPLPLRVVLLTFVMIFGVYVCSVYLKQISLQKYPVDISFSSEKTKLSCNSHDIPPEEIPYVHFPQPKTFSRTECSCTPVRYFALLSMQRSGSGWFETLLNSHPNVSSNGEIFSVKERRSNITAILRTLDAVYALDWLSSASKNECVAAVGFKWMLNQGLMDHHKEILKYFKSKGVSLIFLFRRNLLRRFISVLANNYDRRAKQLNGTHKSHVHSKEEADILAQFKPKINTAVLVSNLSQVESTTADCLKLFNTTRHIILYYEDIISNQNVLQQVQEFLRLPVRNLKSRQVKIHRRPPSEQILNWDDVYKSLNGTKYEHFLHQRDYVT
ncbi:uncharacterized protein LOC109849530 isoform X1 [Asparagus officinalis]|uniref:uncharacterized protein LOC109849530 isoform X1 n=1 Tax=Asparagus officinalis TaxID=4686 RepID=UPI00098E69CD|nr:uncharacterized protein LOC109849530 isoform X1 [Asparagus officinalis]XP_020274967.1 uncharacterized protein LOC109849530 isoform X1 [Asparagus officinalis]